MDADCKKCKEILNKTEEIVRKNEIIHSERMKRGELFNIFNVLKTRSDEARLHSPFIAELLNPEGSHGLGDKFLIEFLKILRFTNFQTFGAKVWTEKHIGYINDDYTEGGRLDIIIEAGDKASAIVIENKIYASDQYGQLLRYKSYLENTLKLDASHYKLLYLTLGGDEPSIESVGNEEDAQNSKNFWDSVSYRDFIREWLGECVKLAAAHPPVREVLNQYLQLIKELTYQTLEENMKEEMVELLMSGQNLKYAQEMASYMDEAKNRIMQERIVPKIRELGNRLNLDYEVPNNLGEKYSEFWFAKDSWKENHFYVGFMFDKKNYSGFYYYINQWDEKRVDKRLLDAFKKIGEHVWHHNNGDEFPWWLLEDISYDCTLPIWCFTDPDKFVASIEKTVSHLAETIDGVLASN